MGKNKKNKDSVDIDQINNEKNISEKDLKQKSNLYKNDKESDDTISAKDFFLRYRIPIISSIVKTKDKHFDDNKKKFYINLSFIIFLLIISVVLIVCGILWISGAFGVNTNNTETGIWPGLLMAFGVCILVVV